MKNSKTEAQTSPDPVTRVISRLTLEPVPFPTTLPLQIWRYLSEFVRPLAFLRLHRCSKGIRDGTLYLCYSRVILKIGGADLHTLLDMKAPCSFLVEHIAGLKSGFLPPEEDKGRDFRADLSILAFANRLDVIRALFDYRPRLWKDASEASEYAIADACLGGHFEIVKYLYNKGVSLHSDCWMAAEYDKGWPLIRFLHRHHCPFHPNALAQTACYGQVKVMKWFISNGYADSVPWCQEAIVRTKNKTIELLLQKQIRKLHLRYKLTGDHSLYLF